MNSLQRYSELPFFIHNTQMNSAQYNFYLVRHALGEHNHAKKKWKQEHNVPHYKDSPDYAQLKFDHRLIDPHVLPQSLQSIPQAATAIGMSKVKLVICSPMRRCLQTCTYLLNGQKNLKVLVEPLLSSRLNSAWSIGSSIQEMKAEFPGFDYSAFAGIEDTWMLKLLQRASKIQSKQVQENAHRNKQFMLEQLSKGKGEDFIAFGRRIIQLKDRLQAILKEHAIPQQSSVLIISHSCVLNFLVAREFNEKGKIKTKESFDYCTPKQFTHSQIFFSNEEDHKAKL